MSDGILYEVSEIIRTYNDSRSIGITSTSLYSSSVITKTGNSEVSAAACLGFAVLILTTVIGNTLVLSALFLDKRLHAPSFFLIANMAIADLLLGLSVLPFSSVLEILNDRWIFGRSFCTAWLALDVLCCTASIIALMAVSIDRYIGVTRPLNYSTIMTTRRTVYLIIIVWGVSILTSVVPLFGLTDQGTKSAGISPINEPFETCKVNKNTFYTIFSSMISFYIPVVILLILYSRVYQEAKKQGEKLENEKRRLYEIDYQIASEHVQQQQNHHHENSIKKQNSFKQTNHNKNGISTALLNHENLPNEDRTHEHSESFDTVAPKRRGHRSFRKHIFSTIKRSSLRRLSHISLDYHQMSANEELQIIKRKLHNLKREKKAFRTVGLILGALLICWLPFFVTLPIISILKHHNIFQDENTENTWFKITFWLGYCNSALNPFVYAFSNRAIRRAFREVIFRRCCCCCCCIWRKKPNHFEFSQRTYSGSIHTDTPKAALRKTKSKLENNVNAPPPPPLSSQAQTTDEPALSFSDFLEQTGADDISSHEDEQLDQEIKKDLTLTST